MSENQEQLCGRLINQYGDTVLRMCFLYLKDYHLAEDTTQEVFIKAIKSYNSFQNQSSEKTWLIRIAINCCKNVMRTKWFKTIHMNLEELELKEKQNPIEDFLIKDSITESIMELEAEDRKIIILYYYQELSIKEIAYVINKTENAVTQKLSRARKKLRLIFQKKGYEEYLYER